MVINSVVISTGFFSLLFKGCFSFQFYYIKEDIYLYICEIYMIYICIYAYINISHIFVFAKYLYFGEMLEFSSIVGQDYTILILKITK